MPDIPERDWRCFKEVQKKLLERFCADILQEFAVASRSVQGTAHARYLKIYKLIEKRDKQIANTFNDFRRSTAITQLGIMRRIKLLSDEDLSMFSEQTRTFIEGIASL